MTKKTCLDKACQYSVVPRDEWGAREPRPGIEKQRYDLPDGTADSFESGNIQKLPMERIIIHHSGWRPTDSAKWLQDWCMDKSGYDDMPYHFYITGDGAIYEGRELKFIGGHAGMTAEANESHDLHLDPDFGSIGIAVAGCFEASCKERFEPSAAQRASLLSLVLFLHDKFPGIKPEDIMGHKDVREKVIVPKGLTPKGDDTVCPGEIYGFVHNIPALIDAAKQKTSRKDGDIKAFAFRDKASGLVLEGVRFRPDDVSLELVENKAEPQEAGLLLTMDDSNIADRLQTIVRKNKERQRKNSFAELWNAAGAAGAMINGGYFGDAGAPKGLLMSDGRQLAPFETKSPFSGLFTVDSDGKWDLKYLKNKDGDIAPPRDLSQYKFALQAGPMIIEPGGKDGIPKPKDKEDDDTAPSFERTVIARTKDGEWFFITTSKTKLCDLQAALHAFAPGIDAAINLDGGPSTALATTETGVLIEPPGKVPVYLRVKKK